MMPRRLTLLLTAGLLASCYIDFRQGIKCETNADCQGLVCVNGQCGDAPNGSSSDNSGGMSAPLSAQVLRVTGDSNGDGQLSPGEQGALVIQIANGGSAVTGLVADLSTTQAGVTITRGTSIKFGDIRSNDSGCGDSTSPGSCYSAASGYPQIALTTAVTAGTEIPFKLVVTDAKGNSFGTLTFSLTVTTIGDKLSAQALRITGDSNGDGQLSPGETGGLVVQVANGGSEVLGLVGTLTTTQEGVTILTNGRGIKFGDIRSDDSGCGDSTSPGSCYSAASTYPQIELTTAVAPGTQIPFQLAVTDSLGNSFGTLTFSLTVNTIGDRLSAQVMRVVGDSNGDGQLSPGETGGLVVQVANGGSEVLGLAGNLSTTQAGVTITRGTGLKFGTIQGNDSACGNATSPGSCYSASSTYPQVTLSSGISPGTQIPFQLSVTDALGNSFGTLSFTLTVGS